MATVTKADLLDSLSKAQDLNRKQAKEIVELLFDKMKEVLGNGTPIKISGFGNFDLRDKNERPGRNPKTGEDVGITARRVVTFKPSNKLKERLDSNQGLEQAVAALLQEHNELELEEV